MTALDEVELEFLKFAHYSNLWWSTVLDPEFRFRQIKREYIAKRINLQFRTNISVQVEDMARYQAAHQRLTKMIDRDEQIRILWYDNRKCWTRIQTAEVRWGYHPPDPNALFQGTVDGDLGW